MPRGGGAGLSGGRRHGGTEVIQLVVDGRVLAELVRDQDKLYRRQNGGRALISGA
jgi:hypothetical protein